MSAKHKDLEFEVGKDGEKGQIFKDFGKACVHKELETIRPRFYVYEGGSVHTVT